MIKGLTVFGFLYCHRRRTLAWLIHLADEVGGVIKSGSNVDRLITNHFEGVPPLKLSVVAALIRAIPEFLITGNRKNMCTVTGRKDCDIRP